MRRGAFGLLVLLAACQSPLARDYPGPWTRPSPEGWAAYNALGYRGSRACVERRHATVANQFLFACSPDLEHWSGLVVATGRREPLASHGYDEIAALGLPPRELIPAR